MTALFTWGGVGSVYHLLTTELNSLAIATATAAGPEIDNTTNKYQLGQLYVHMGSAAFVAGNFINIYLVPSSDTAGTTYPTFTSAAAGAWSNYLAGVVYINGSTAVQNEILANIVIPLGKFKCYAFTGGSCPSLAASGNTVDLYPTPTQY